ncbi:hypothetical protein FSARC_4595 [Fusarium sarcochroum]|uniref:Uncharacterized protein n=1 Tax=Fusarium sarcochroum TaxID=1208366 RepID=A0A8H4U1K1_9HYPO|nr:hypothetical protein FSARC_4595 [Fusarium sarcochroum]
MKPVEEADINAIVEQGSILILDMTQLAINFIHEIICHSPNHISTKNGKSLPSEIWLQILSWMECDDEGRLYPPVYPFPIQDSKTGPILVCKALESWSTCGDIKMGDYFNAYQDYLRYPHKVQDNHDRPFQLPECQDGAISIPINSLRSDKKFLFHNVDVADMIAWGEDGACSLCGSGREFCAGCRGVGDILEEFVYLPSSADCSVRVLCPLCIGRTFAEASLEVQAFDDGWAQDEEIAQWEEEYDAWVGERMIQLGYEL